MLYIVLFILLLVVVFASLSIKIIQQSEVLMIERLGKYHKTAQSGLNFVIPILDRVVKKIDLRTQVIDSPPQPVITKDNVTMAIDTVVYYQITDPFKATYEIASLVQAIRYLTTTTVRDIIGTMELDKTLSSRDDVNNRLRIILDEATDRWGVRVERVEIKNIELPEDIREAMEKQMRAEREKRAMILTAEGKKQSSITEAQGLKESQILKAEAQKQTTILDAEAEKESKVRRAEGEAEAIKQVAEAEADKIKFIYDALKNANIDEAMLSVKYIEALNEMAKGNNKVFIPYESKGLLGSVAAIKEIINEDKK
jgi:regulator of protease activity HflC (stomatin/prohibitin superfamily)